MIKIMQHLYLIPMLVSAILSLKAFRLRWPLAYKIFSVLLFIALITEVAANLWHYYLYNFSGMHYSNNNAWIYTSSFIPQYILFFFVYHQALHSKLIKSLVVIVSLLFSLFVIINAWFIQKAFLINSNTHIAADCIMLLLIFSYFEQLRKEKEIVKLSDQPMVWISLGAFIFHLLNIPFLLMINYLNKSLPSVALAFFYVYLLFIFVSYVLYSKAFLCKTPQPK
jgi:hypothetical protein